VPGDWTIEVFEADNGSQPFAQFVAKLTPAQRLALNAAVEHRLVPFGMELVRTEWMKPLKEGLYELRIRHHAHEIARLDRNAAPGSSSRSERILLRVFVHFYGNRIVLLLGGYDKGKEPSERRQQHEIASARKLLRQFQSRQRRDREERQGRGPS
jgi:putative component of toxin-antitoxin plasmid stabilization module